MWKALYKGGVLKGVPLRTGTFGIGLCLFALALPFFPDEKLVRLKLFSFELSVFVLLLITGLSVLSREKVRWSPLALLASFWFGMNALLYFVSAESALAEAEMRRVLLAVGTFIVFRFGPFTDEWKSRFWMTWTAAAGLAALYGILQFTGGVGSLSVPKMDRVMGTFGNPIFFAAYLLFSLFIALKGPGPRWVRWPSVALQTVALYLTQTRAAWLSILVVAFIVVLVELKSRKIPWGAIGFGVVFAAGFLIGTQDIWKRDQGHLLIWRDTLRMAADHPVAGVGLGAFHVVFPEYAGDDLKSKWPQGKFIVNYAHNEYIQTAAEGGIPLATVFLSLCFIFFRKGLRNGMTGPWLAGTALLIQNFFSVDMRFGIDFALFFAAAGFIDQPKERPSSTSLGTPARLISAGVFLAVMGGAVLPVWIKPYRAEKKVRQQADFFDERLLDANKTISDMESLADRYPDEAAVWERLAYLYAKEMMTPDRKINVKRAGQAIEAYKKIIAIDPNRVAAHNNHANVLYTMNKIGPAIEQWEKAVRVNPDFIDGHLNLGKVYYSQGKLKESADHFEKVLEIDPNNAEAVVYLKKMVE